VIRSTDNPVGGVIVLSPAFHVLYMSPHARKLTRPLAISPAKNQPGLILPHVFQDLAQEFHQRLQASLREGNGLACNMERRISSPEGTLFVRGLAVPNQHEGEFLTVLLVSQSSVGIPLPGHEGPA
jgi:hypothetical protein